MQQNTSKPAIRTGANPELLQLHGVLVRVFGIGVLLIGESGIGKSECALDLITRGHQLVADDIINVEILSEEVSGTPPELTQELLEIRGLGVINVRAAFGVGAVCDRSPIELCVELQKATDIDRIGNVIQQHAVGVRRIPKFLLPVTPGRNLAVLVETAARVFLNRGSGADAGPALLDRHQTLLEAATDIQA